MSLQCSINWKWGDDRLGRHNSRHSQRGICYGVVLHVYTGHTGKKDHTSKETCHQQELDGLEAAKCDRHGGILGFGNDDDYDG